MANPMQNICANFDQVGKVRASPRRRLRAHCNRLIRLIRSIRSTRRLTTDVIEQAFAEHYYNTFDADRSQLGPLYNESYSMLNFEHSDARPGQYKGSAAIVEKLRALPFQQVKHQVVTLDTQPSPNGGVIVMVCGNLLIDGEQRAQKFSQTFQLMPTEAAGLAPGSYFIFNDVFRLNVG